jgi:hypothetical protein
LNLSFPILQLSGQLLATEPLPFESGVGIVNGPHGGFVFSQQVLDQICLTEPALTESLHSACPGCRLSVIGGV